MRPYSPEHLKREGKEAQPNPYDEMQRSERTARYLRLHTFEEKGPSRKETKLFLDSIARLLPSPAGSAPMKADILDKVFRGTPKRVKAAERAAKKDLREMAKKEDRSLARKLLDVRANKKQADKLVKQNRDLLEKAKKQDF